MSLKRKTSKKKTPTSVVSKRKYEGASKSKRLSRWVTQSTSAISAISGGLITLRDRSRDLRRNNPYAAKAIQVITSNVIGEGIVTQFRGPEAETLEEIWEMWAETKAIDFDGRNNIYGLQRLMMDAVAESGEVLIRKRFDSSKDFPLQYQILESDFLDINKTEAGVSGNVVVQGIEFDPQGRRVAYHLYEEHPGSYNTGLIFSQKSNRVLASDVKHIYRMDRPGQARGVPWLAPIIIRLKDLDDYEDAQLMRQKIAACFTAFVRDLSSDLTDSDDDCGDDLSDRLEPAMIEHLPPGKTIEFVKPPEVQNYREYTSTVLHSIAAGVGVTYEALTGDLSQVNFSSARLGWLEFGRNIKAWRAHVIVAHGLDPIAEDFLDIAKIKGVKVEGASFVHVAPTREMIDPTKEVPATIEAIRAGLTTLSAELLAQGKNPQYEFQKYKEDMDALDALGLKVESDPRNPKNGVAPSTAQGGSDEQKKNKNSDESDESTI